MEVNPYRPAMGSQPPFLAGRDGELFALEREIHDLRHGRPSPPAILTGQRGVGKTVLLRRCDREAEKLGAIVLRAEAGPKLPLTTAFANDLEEAHRSLRNIPAKLRSALEQVWSNVAAIPVFELPGEAGAIRLQPATGEQPTPVLESELRTLNRSARENDRFLVLSIDEIQDADPDELRPIFRLMQELNNTDQPLMILAAGLPNAVHVLQTKVRTYLQRPHEYKLGLLDSEETRRAIEEPVSVRKVRIASAALDALVEASGGYPYFIQEYASAAWAFHSGHQITEEDVRRAIIGTRRMLEATLYERMFAGVTPREVAYIVAMADLGEGPHSTADIAGALGSTSEELSSIRNQLVRKDVLVSPAPGLVEFYLPLTERYIASHRPNFDKRLRNARPPHRHRASAPDE